MLGLRPTAGLQVPQHRRGVGAGRVREQGAVAVEEGRRHRMPIRGGDGRVALQQRDQHVPPPGAHDLSHTRPHQHSPGRDGAEMHQLFPHPPRDVGHRFRLQAPVAAEGSGQRGGASVHPSVLLAEGQPAPVAEMLHDAVGGQRRLAFRQPPPDPRGAEGVVQGGHMRQPVQHRQDGGARFHRRADRGDRVVQVIGLAG